MRLTRAVKTGAAVAVSAAVGVTAASAFVGAPPAAVTVHSPVAQPGSDEILQTVRDPERGLDWTVRGYVSTSGGSCVEAGQISDGRFGHVGRGGAFREAPVQQSGTCGSLLAEPVLLAVNHYPPSGGRAARTVLFGQVRPDVTQLAVTAPDGTHRLDPGLRGGFVLPFTGAIAPTELPVQATLAGGQRLTFDWR